MATKDTTKADEKAKEEKAPRNEEQDVKAAKKASDLMNNKSGGVQPGQAKSYRKLFERTGADKFVLPMTKAQAKKYATGDDRIPRDLRKALKPSYSQDMEPSHVWLKGIIAYAVACDPDGAFDPNAKVEVPTDGGTEKEGDKATA